MLKIALICCCMFVVGCGTKPGRFDNRVLTTLTGDRGFVGLLLGSVGLTFELSADDARELRRLREKSLEAPK